MILSGDELTAEVLEEIVGEANTIRVGPTVFERMADNVSWTTPGSAVRFTAEEIVRHFGFGYTAGDVSVASTWTPALYAKAHGLI